MKNKMLFAMTVIDNGDFTFPFECRAYSAKQAVAYAKKVYGRYIMVRDLRDVN